MAEQRSGHGHLRPNTSSGKEEDEESSEKENKNGDDVSLHELHERQQVLHMSTWVRGEQSSSGRVDILWLRSGTNIQQLRSTFLRGTGLVVILGDRGREGRPTAEGDSRRNIEEQVHGVGKRRPTSS